MRLDFTSFAVSVLLLAAALPPARAQSTDATIVGLVRDPSGASVAGVTVTATNVGTNISKSVRSNDTGNFDIPALRPGEYTVSAETQGFKKQMITGVGLQVNQVARVDIALQLGEVAEQVTVEARALLVVTETGAMGQVIDNRRIVDTARAPARRSSSWTASPPTGPSTAAPACCPRSMRSRSSRCRPAPSPPSSAAPPRW